MIRIKAIIRAALEYCRSLRQGHDVELQSRHRKETSVANGTDEANTIRSLESLLRCAIALKRAGHFVQSSESVGAGSEAVVQES